MKAALAPLVILALLGGCRVSVTTRGADEAEEASEGEASYESETSDESGQPDGPRPATGPGVAPRTAEERPAKSAPAAEESEREEAEFNLAVDRAQKEEAQRRQAVEPPRSPPAPGAIGTFDWSQSNYDAGTGSDCEIWQSERLTVTIDERGAANWSAFSNGEARCQQSTGVPTNCGTQGVGYVEELNGETRLVTTQRGRFGGGGTPSVLAIWKCGSLTVRTPIDAEPIGSQHCYRMGSEPDAAVERASELVCQYVELFPDLNQEGAAVLLVKDGLSLKRKKGNPIKLKRRTDKPKTAEAKKR